MLSAVALVDELVAKDALMFGPWRLTNCTACGRPLPQVPLPRCAKCGGLSEPYEGVWICADEGTGRAMAQAFTVCHHHACRRDREALWRVLDVKLRQRYHFPVEDGSCQPSPDEGP
jgi:hypothetical protein